MDLGLDVLNRVASLNIKRDGLASQCSNEDLHCRGAHQKYLVSIMALLSCLQQAKFCLTVCFV
jgi:hypothetical protein